MSPSAPPPPRSSQQPDSVDLRSLPSSLLSLVRAPKRLSALLLWKALESHEQAAVLKGHIRHQANRTRLVRIVAGERNFREVTVRRWDNDKIVKWALPLRLSNALARDLLHQMHVERRSEMLAHFLNALQIPNEDGIPKRDDETGEFSQRNFKEEDVFEAAEDLVREHGLRRAIVYFLTLDILGAPFTDHLWSWMKRSLERASADATDEPAATEPDDEDLYEEAADEESDPGRHRSFTPDPALAHSRAARGAIMTGGCGDLARAVAFSGPDRASAEGRRGSGGVPGGSRRHGEWAPRRGASGRPGPGPVRRARAAGDRSRWPGGLVAGGRGPVRRGRTRARFGGRGR